MNRASTGLLALLAACGASPQTNAQTIGECDSALVMATFTRQDRRFLDWRLADKVDENTYSEIRRNAGANAVIYGVPMGANYGEFKNNAKNYRREQQESLTLDETRNIQWTGLDPNAVTTYSECLKAFAQSRSGLHLLPKTATDTDISFELVYTVAGAMPNPARLSWTGGNISERTLPRQASAGSTMVIVRRPDRQHTLAVNTPGYSDSIILTPLPAPPDPFASDCVITTTSDPSPVLRKGGETSWSCPPLRTGRYTATVKIDPASSPAIPFRVGWTMQLSFGEREGRRTIDLNRASGDPIDINISAGIGTNFQTSGQSVEITQGVPVFTLRINGVANHCCFHTTQHDDGAVVIPRNVEISLRRAGP
jgi:hypothetical protein